MKKIWFTLLIASSLNILPGYAQVQQDAIGTLSPQSQVYFNRILNDFKEKWNKREKDNKWKVSLSSGIAVQIDNEGNATCSVHISSRNTAFDRVTLEYARATPVAKPPATWNKDQTVMITYSYRVKFGKENLNTNDLSAVNEFQKGLSEYNDKNNASGALEHFKKAIEIDPYLVAARANLGGAYNFFNQYSDAVKQFEEVIRLDPDDEGARWALAATYCKVGNIAEAKKQASLISPSSQFFKDAQALVNAISEAKTPGRSQDSEYQAASLYNEGVTLDLKKDYQGAIPYYQKAILVSPDYFNAHCALGNAYFKLNKIQEAVNELKECLRIQPENDDIKFLLGTILHGSGKITEGMALIDSIKPGTDAYKHAQEYLTMAKTTQSNASTPPRQNQTTTETVVASSEDTPIKDKWALVIGISKFANPQYNLKYASKDAQDFYNYLITEGNFKKDHVLLLLNENATRRNIMSAFGDKFLPAVCQKGDLFTIYISTHGTPANKDPGKRNFIIAYDTESEALYETGVDMDELYRRVKEGVDTDRGLIVMDTCYSGAGVPGARGVDDVANFDVSTLALGNGHLVMTSSSPRERSWESKVTPNGVFTKYLIQNLKLTRGNVKDSFEKLQGDVGWEVKNAFNQAQHPQMGGEWKGKQLILNAIPNSPRPNLNPDLLKMMNIQTGSGASKK